MKNLNKMVVVALLVVVACSDKKADAPASPNPDPSNPSPYTNNPTQPGNNSYTGDGTGTVVPPPGQVSVLPRPEPLSLAGMGNWSCITNTSSAQAALQAQNLPATIGNINNVVNYVTTNQNQIFAPATPMIRTFAPNKRLRVVTWNVHHGVDPQGQCYQLPSMIALMNLLQADVFLLQEVNAFDAQALTDGTGMRGYFGYTYPTAGNMMLIHPSLVVNEQRSTLTTHTGISNMVSLGLLYSDWLTKKTVEPRNVQNLLLSNGVNTFAIWNSHLPLADCAGTCQSNVLNTVDTQIKSQASRAHYSFGGGDMNGFADHFYIKSLEARGFRGDAMGGIDWIFATGVNGPAEMTVQKQEIKNASGQQLSDHPIVWTDILIQ